MATDEMTTRERLAEEYVESKWRDFASLIKKLSVDFLIDMLSRDVLRATHNAGWDACEREMRKTKFIADTKVLMDEGFERIKRQATCPTCLEWRRELQAAECPGCFSEKVTKK